MHHKGVPAWQLIENVLVSVQRFRFCFFRMTCDFVCRHLPAWPPDENISVVFRVPVSRYSKTDDFPLYAASMNRQQMM